MTARVFPPHISTPSDALDYLPVWAERFGGVIRDGVRADMRHTDGTLLWREDNHGGHEHDHGGPCHLHIGPEGNRRVPASPATLASIAEKVVAAHIRFD